MTEPVSLNCEACSKECFEEELETIRLSGYGSDIRICDKCACKNPENQYKDAISLLNKISSSISDKKCTPEERIERIKKMIDGDF